jgi:hypothetical protein
MSIPVDILFQGKDVAPERPLPVGGSAPVYLLKVPVDTAAHAAADVLFQPIALEGITANPGDTVFLHNIFVVDMDDQGLAFDIFFFDQRPVVAANNAAWATTDIEMEKCQDVVRVTAGDYIDTGANRVAPLPSLGRQLVTVGSNTLWIAGQAIGAPTYAGGFLKIKIGFIRA